MWCDYSYSTVHCTHTYHLLRNPGSCITNKTKANVFRFMEKPISCMLPALSTQSFTTGHYFSVFSWLWTDSLCSFFQKLTKSYLGLQDSMCMFSNVFYFNLYCRTVTFFWLFVLFFIIGINVFACYKTFDHEGFYYRHVCPSWEEMHPLGRVVKTVGWLEAWKPISA